MKHFGDITKLSGYELPVVDIITGGSPCQDLSVAGKRAGLAGERSGLFMEQIRLVKEMREKYERDTGRTGFLVRPRFMVWENVPGAFSSNGGKDFQAVLEEIVGIVEADVPDLSDAVQGKWTKAGCLYDELGKWSVAWRVHDAQYWGVPQRRKRIALVADFGGLSAPEILFERNGLSRDSEQGGAQGERAAGGAESGAGGTICLQGIGIDRADTAGCNGRGWCEDVSYTLNTIDRPAVYPTVANTNIVCAGFKAGQSKDGGIGYAEEQAPMLSANPSALEPTVLAVDAYNHTITGEIAATLSANSCETATRSGPSVLQTFEPILLESNQNHATVQTDGISTALPASMGMGGGYVPMVYENHSQDSRYNPLGDICETVSAKYGTGGNNMPMIVEPLPFDTTQVTSDKNWSHPHYGDPCHPLAAGAHVPAITYQDVTGALTPGAHPGSYNGQDAYNDMLVTMPVVFDKEMYNCGEKMDGVPQARYDNIAPTVRADSHPSGVCTSTVRRLTPLECERLQGFPDNWTNIGEWTDSKGKKHKDADSPRYKALGNSIALPFWAWMARRICAQYERPMTMASLFDGIGGFPLVFSRAGAVPVWASEIEEFCVAVTKERFGEE